MNEKEILEKINSILETAKIIAENNVDMDDFEMEIDVPERTICTGQVAFIKRKGDSYDWKYSNPDGKIYLRILNTTMYDFWNDLCKWSKDKIYR